MEPSVPAASTTMSALTLSAPSARRCQPAFGLSSRSSCTSQRPSPALATRRTLAWVKISAPWRAASGR